MSELATGDWLLATALHPPAHPVRVVLDAVPVCTLQLAEKAGRGVRVSANAVAGGAAVGKLHAGGDAAAVRPVLTQQPLSDPRLRRRAAPHRVVGGVQLRAAALAGAGADVPRAALHHDAARAGDDDPYLHHVDAPAGPDRDRLGWDVQAADRPGLSG